MVVAVLNVICLVLLGIPLIHLLERLLNLRNILVFDNPQTQLSSLSASNNSCRIFDHSLCVAKASTQYHSQQQMQFHGKVELRSMPEETSKTDA